MSEYEVNDLYEALSKSLRKNNQTFFSYAWREQIENMIATESKYSRLVEWIDREIELSGELLNVFSPADKTEDYTKGYLANYLEQIQKYAVLVHCKDLLLDSRTTTQMRENIEYTLGKLYGIHYSNELEIYV